MTRFTAYYDKLARTHSLNWALTLTLLYPFFAYMGFFKISNYFTHHDSFDIVVGSIWMLLGVLGIFHGVNVTHAVVRRLIAEAREA